MKIVFNGVTNRSGGAVQNCVNFILHSLDDAENTLQWIYLINTPIANNLISKFKNLYEDKRFIIVDESPARSKKARGVIKSVIADEHIDMVYTMAGPAYMNFGVPHVMGCSEPYVTHARIENYFSRGFMSGISTILLSILRSYYFRKCDHLVFQTTSSRMGFVRRFGWAISKTSVISNAIGKSFTQFSETPTMKLPTDASTKRILVPSAYYTHKNLEIIIPTAAALKEKLDTSFEFVLTIPFNENWHDIKELAEKFNVTDNVVNIGTYTTTEAPKLYADATLVFLPTRLETFSTSYLEALWSGTPVVTSDLQFARDICGDSVKYTSTLDPDKCADMLYSLIRDEVLYKDMSKKGNTRVLDFPNSMQRYNAIVDLLKTFAV